MPIEDRTDKVELFLLKTKMVPFEAIIVPRVNLRIPEETDPILSASIKISPNSSREDK